MPARRVTVLGTLVFSAALAACGGSDPSPTTGTESGQLASPAVCDPGATAQEVAAEPDRHWPPPPQPIVSTNSGSGCAEPIAFCVPWIRNCGMPLPLILPKNPVSVRPGDEVQVDFAVPVSSVSAQVEPDGSCDTAIQSTGEDGRSWRLILPESIWGEDSPRCGSDGDLEGSFVADYGPGGVFAGYQASFGLRLKPET